MLQQTSSDKGKKSGTVPEIPGPLEPMNVAVAGRDRLETYGARAYVLYYSGKFIIVHFAR